MALRPPPLIFPPAVGRHTATVIFAHGLGDTARGWSPAVENWRRRGILDEVKFVLPNARAIPISCNMGMAMSGWFDIKYLDGSVESLQRDEDRQGHLESRAYLHDLIAAEVAAGIPSDRIVIGGFSQGGAVAILAGLSAPTRLAGVVGLSCWLPLSQTFRDLLPDDNANEATPVLMCHGAEDPLVRTELAKRSVEMLKSWGYNVEFEYYNGMGHSACPEELDRVQEWLSQRLPAQNGAESAVEQ